MEMTKHNSLKNYLSQIVSKKYGSTKIIKDRDLNTYEDSKDRYKILSYSDENDLFILIFTEYSSWHENEAYIDLYNTLLNLLKESTIENITLIIEKQHISNGVEVVLNALGFDIVREAHNIIEYMTNTFLVRQNSDDVFNKSETYEDIVENLHDAIQLYLHEDNLNWTKLGLLITLTFAFMTAFFVILEQDKTPANLIIATVLITMGFFLNYMFHQKLISGIYYMASHKKRVREIERILTYFQPNHVMLIEILDSKISNQSKTVSLIFLIPWFGYIAWMISYLLALINYFGLY